MVDVPTAARCGGYGTAGELAIRGDNIMKGYWNKPRKPPALRDGWFHTGDGGYMDEEGYIFLVDRKKDMIISGGENIYRRGRERASAHTRRSPTAP